ncbi:MAG: hypothetical protein WCL00_07390 [Bacteroidota bacterium]
MKNLTQIFFIVLFCSTILLSCSKIGGDSFIGTWQNYSSQKELIISKVNDTIYKVLVRNLESNQNGSSINSHMSTFKDGNLIDMKNCLILSYFKEKLLLDGKEYNKVQDANPAEIEKEENFAKKREYEEKRLSDSIRSADSAAMAQAEAQKKADGK